MQTIPRMLALSAIAVAACFGDHLEVPAGAQISVRTNETIDSREARVGDRFDAQIEDAVTAENGQTVIPRGARASLVLREFDRGGTTGSRELVLDLDSVMVDGRRYYVGSSTEFSGERGIGKNRRTAEYTGGGAALGAIIGAIAGGGKGAVIGGLAGAGAGAAAQVMTRGDKVRVPAESVLTFRLENPLRLATR